VLVGPLVPDPDSILGQVAGVGIAGEEPEKLVDDGVHMQLLGGDERKAFRQVEAHLVAEDGKRPGSGSVGLPDTFLKNPTEKIVILAHSAECSAIPGGSPMAGQTLIALACAHCAGHNWTTL